MTFRALSRLTAATLMMWTTPVVANDYAETASKLANAILEGASEVQRELLPPLKKEEYEELLGLAGCKALMGASGGSRYLVIDWRCDSEGHSSQSDRSTVMIFDDFGKVVGFAINRSFGSLTPTEVALAQSDLPSPRVILRDFGEAVVSGGDPTLDGLIDLNKFDQVRLARYRNGHFRVSSKTFDGQFRIYLYEGKGRSSPRTAATLQIDEAGRPTGLIFAPTYLANFRSAGDYDRVYNHGITNTIRRAQPGCSGIVC